MRGTRGLGVEYKISTLMRHEAIEMVCAHVLQGQEPPPHRWGVLGAASHTWIYFGIVPH